MLVNQGHQDGALLRRDRLPCAVAGQADVAAVPSVAAGNAASHGVGLGQMNLSGYLAPQRIHYGSEKSDDFTNALYPQHSITSLACRKDPTAPAPGELEPGAGRQGPRGVEPVHRQLLAPGEGSAVHRHSRVATDAPGGADADHAGGHGPDHAGHRADHGGGICRIQGTRTQHEEAAFEPLETLSELGLRHSGRSTNRWG